MRERITFMHDPEAELNISQLQVQGKKLVIEKLAAAREDTLTFAPNELPIELNHALQSSHEVHIRWASPRAFEAVSPYVSRVPPGLHVFATPQAQSTSRPLCTIIKGFFGQHMKCASQEASFTNLLTSNKRFTSSSASQYYHVLHFLDDFSNVFASRFCTGDKACLERARLLKSADSIDLDYDAVSTTATLKIYWSKCPTADSWSLTVDGNGTDIEVGVLTNDRATDVEELSMGGYLTMVGKDEKPSTALFSFPARHHTIDPTTFNFTTRFLPPTGLHPTLQIHFPFVPQPPRPTCSLHAYLTLPSHLFIDRHQFADPLFLSSKNIHRLRSLRGEEDLEAPDWTIDKWGSATLVEMQRPASGDTGPWSVDVPLHLRYLEPNRGTKGIAEVEQPWPAVFWACRAEDGTKMATSPFDRVNIGFDTLFGPKTMFYHVSPKPETLGGLLVERIQVPVIDLDRAEWVDVGTTLVILLGFGITLLVLVRGFLKGRTSSFTDQGKKTQ
ncbi:MAG: protease B nonderepressible form [Vezdaea aestivalis]|nr:MAG: protease B nonderepressible form [Vezdaea aestivalis]